MCCGLRRAEKGNLLGSDLHALSSQVVSADLQSMELFTELLWKMRTSSDAFSIKKTGQPEKVGLRSLGWPSALRCKLVSSDVREGMISAHI